MHKLNVWAGRTHSLGPVAGPERPWETARRVTDNHLRALRYWIEASYAEYDPSSPLQRNERIILGSLRGILADLLRTSASDRDDVGYNNIGGVLRELDEIDTSRPDFARIYECINLAVPHIVKGRQDMFHWSGRRIVHH